MLTKYIRIATRREYQQFIYNSENSLHSDPKKFWSFVNQKMRTSNIPGRLIHNGNILTKQQDIVYAFAGYFSSVFDCDYDSHRCDNSCDTSNLCPDKFCCPSTSNMVDCDNTLSFLSMFAISEDDIFKAVKKMHANNVSSPDDIPAFIIKNCRY